MTDERPPEAARDQEVSGFTPLLRDLWTTVPTTLVAAFVDMLGECVDYVSSLDPYDAKVSAAHSLILVSQLMERADRLGGGAPVMLEISADARDLWARRVSDDYVLVVVAQAGTDRILMRQALLRATQAFRTEAGVDTPPWDSDVRPLVVEVRAAVGWAYAPTAYVVGGERVGVVGVMGRWREDTVHGETRTCFRVRTSRDEDVTLAHDEVADRWDVLLRDE